MKLFTVVIPVRLVKCMIHTRECMLINGRYFGFFLNPACTFKKRIKHALLQFHYTYYSSIIPAYYTLQRNFQKNHFKIKRPYVFRFRFLLPAINYNFIFKINIPREWISIIQFLAFHSTKQRSIP